MQSGFQVLKYHGYAVVTPLRKAVSYEQRKTNLGNLNFWRHISRSATYYAALTRVSSLPPCRRTVDRADFRPKKKKCYVALSRPTFFFFFFFFFFFLCQIWAKNLLKFVFNGLKKHLHDLYMRFDCIPPEFSPFRNFKKNIGKLNSLTVRKKKKKIPTDRPNFQILVG